MMHISEFTPPPECLLPADGGNCGSFFVDRWFYNTETGQCKMFGWNCRGNENRFLTEVDCRVACLGEGGRT